jgi:hypothetical protein
MYIVREEFTAKPGMASKLAGVFKQAAPHITGYNVRVLTDTIGRFNTVVIETEVDDLATFDKRMQEYSAKPEMREILKGYADLYQTGRREVYRVM